jgi:hypothetical protein
MGNVRVEFVHDPLRHRMVIGASEERRVVEAVAWQLIAEAEERAEVFAGIDDLHAAHEVAEAKRLRRILEIVLPGVDFE